MRPTPRPWILSLLACCGEDQVTVRLDGFGDVPIFALRIENGRQSIERYAAAGASHVSLRPGDSIFFIAIDPRFIASRTPYFDERRLDEVELALGSARPCAGGLVSRDQAHLVLAAPDELEVISVDELGVTSGPRALSEIPGLAGELSLEVPASFDSCAGDSPFSIERFGPILTEGPLATDALGPSSRLRGLIPLEDGRLLAITWYELVLVEADGRVPDDGAHVRSFKPTPGIGEIFGAAIHPPRPDGSRIVTLAGFRDPGGGLARDVVLGEAGLLEISTATVGPTAFRGAHVADGRTYLLEESGRIWKREDAGFRIERVRFGEMYRLGSAGSPTRPHVVLGRDGYAFEGDLVSDRWAEIDNPKEVGVNLWAYARLPSDEVWLGASKGLFYAQRPGRAWTRFNLQVPAIESCTPTDECGWSDLPLTVHSATLIGRDHLAIAMESCDRLVIVRAADRCAVVLATGATALSVTEPDGAGGVWVGGDAASIYRVRRVQP
ncbi:MAG: hypothetical protein HYV07_22655 [Deltaproteobacteria bacterium]|nr:hypothetical protein [Deltaproteobacteria bacterium]